MPEEIESNVLTVKKNEDISRWYSQLLRIAEIVDQNYDLKGTFVWKGYGYQAMHNIKALWDKLFKEAGIEEMYFPLIIPMNYAKINESWFNSFSKEGYKVIAGEDNQVQGILRPTGEPAMYPMFQMWIKNHTDLPLRIYETVSSFRYETKHTRPLIRDREITVWHEIHTVHATKEDAEKESQLHISMWDKIWKDLAMPPLKVIKPQWECFAGAVGSVEYYSVMPSGKVMENGSVNNLGQAYAKKFNIKFKDSKGEDQYGWQLCTGNGARLLAAVLMIHGDDRGIIMPPKIAPIQAVIVPIIYKGKEDLVENKCIEIEKKLKKKFSIKLDNRDKTAGSKFYDWEIKGVPLRIEIGPKDITDKQVTIVRRDTFEKYKVNEKDLVRKVSSLLKDIQSNILKKATEELEAKLEGASTIEDISNNIKKGHVSMVSWCKSPDCYDAITKFEEGVEGFGTDMKEKWLGKCLHCGKTTKTRLYVAKSY